MMRSTAAQIIYTQHQTVRVVGDAAAIARSIDRDYRLQINQDQVLWEEAKQRVNGADIVLLHKDTLIGAQVHRIHVYSYGEGPGAGIIFVAATRYGKTWRLADSQFARTVGMDTLYEACVDEVLKLWHDVEKGEGKDKHRLLDELAKQARQEVLDMHWKPWKAAKYTVEELLLEEVV